MSLFAVTPALPLHAAGKYVAGAYIVFVAVILIYVAIMAIRLGRTERALVELGQDVAQRDETVAERGGGTATGAARVGPADTGAARVGGREHERDSTLAGRAPGDSPL